MYTFVYEHLHHFREWNIPLQDVIQEIKEQIVCLCISAARGCGTIGQRSKREVSPVLEVFCHGQWFY